MNAIRATHILGRGDKSETVYILAFLPPGPGGSGPIAIYRQDMGSLESDVISNMLVELADVVKNKDRP